MKYSQFPIVVLFLFFLLPLSAEEGGGNAIERLDAFIAEQEASGRLDRERAGWRTRLPKFPEVEFSEGGKYVWILETTEGEITAELFSEVAPDHVRNILYLSRLGFYDGLVFHRIVPGFMAQGGCPEGRGTGGPGYTLPLEVDEGVLHEVAGMLSMARTEQPDSAGSQFFITFGPTPQLDMGYSVFGRVIDGMETVEELEAAGNPNPQADGVPPLKEITLTRSRVEWRAEARDDQ